MTDTSQRRPRRPRAGRRAPGQDGARPDGRVTLQDVADLAGVSLTTASRVVNEGSRKVGAAMIDRVSRAVAELGYEANLQARAVATGRGSMIGVMVHNIDDPYFSSIAAGLIDVTHARKLLVCISSTTSREAGESEYVSLMRAQRARAVILVGSRSDNGPAREALRAEIEAFTRDGGRVVCVGQDMLGVDTIMPENKAGAAALARALVALGHRSFAVLAGPRDVLTARDRADGFRDGLSAWSVDLDPRWIVAGAFTRDGGYEAMSAVLASGPARPDCVFAVNDVMAVGALARLRAQGIAVPDDIAVAGFDDIHTLRDVYPPLTTVRLPLKRMGEMAASLVLSEAASVLPRIIPVPGEVILRDSTLPRPRQRG
ncbi:MAG TPA: LacI family DNA-binding transcriptional regulator [Streptosporangiaceae bacterium]|nr:LacI family DNA-binding transcriptional regulator [Streptosporangiaceae bacterium]